MTSTRALVLCLLLASGCPETPKPPPPPPPPPSTLAPVRPDQVCGVMRAVVTEEVGRLETACKRPSDCALYPMQYDPCEPPVALAQLPDGQVHMLDDTLRNAREQCHFVPVPCKARQNYAACQFGKCVVREGTPAPEFFARLSSATSAGTTPLASVKVSVQLIEQPNCMRDPCPSMPLGQRNVQTDADGLMHFELADANKAIITVEGHEPATVWIRANDGPNDVPTPYALKKKP